MASDWSAEPMLASDWLLLYGHICLMKTSRRIGYRTQGAALEGSEGSINKTWTGLMTMTHRLAPEA